MGGLPGIKSSEAGVNAGRTAAAKPAPASALIAMATTGWWDQTRSDYARRLGDVTGDALGWRRLTSIHNCCGHFIAAHLCGKVRRSKRVAMKLLHALVMGIALVSPCANASSLAAFAVANTFCEKASLGMAPIDAYDVARTKVFSNSLYDRDWLLPNWNRALSAEIERLCPGQIKRLNAAYAAQKKQEAAVAKAAAAAAATAANKKRKELAAAKLAATGGSRTAFYVADTFCTLTKSGTPPIAAFKDALARVMTTSVYGSDYQLPNWKESLTTEIGAICPTELDRFKDAFALSGGEIAETECADLMCRYEKALKEQRQLLRSQ